MGGVGELGSRRRGAARNMRGEGGSTNSGDGGRDSNRNGISACKSDRTENRRRIEAYEKEQEQEHEQQQRQRQGHEGMLAREQE